MNLLRWPDTNGGYSHSFLRCVRSMLDGLSRREKIGWVVCLALAVGLTLFGSAYFVASSFMSADMSDLRPADSIKHGAPLQSH